MHSAVMQNKKYMKFAEKSTVEVLALGRLDEAVKKGESRAATYKGKDGVERMVEWPSLTLDQIVSMRSSKAGSYNDTGGIPCTAIVDPHTLKRVKFLRGGQSAKGVKEAAESVAKALKKEHGKGLSRKTIGKINGSMKKANELSTKGDFAKALKELAGLKKVSQSLPKSFQEKIETSRQGVIDAASTKLDEVLAGDPVKVKRNLQKLISKLKGTGLEEKARQALKEAA